MHGPRELADRGEERRCLPAPGDVTKASITARLNGFEKATEKFVSELGALPPPDTAEGRAAQKELDEQLLPGARGEIASARTVASTIAANGSMLQVAAALAALPDSRALKAAARSTLTAVQSAKGSLASSFTSERACRQVG